MTRQLNTISSEVELPEALDESITKYLEAHPRWSKERLDQAAYSLFLMQNGVKDPAVNALYLDSLFGEA